MRELTINELQAVSGGVVKVALDFAKQLVAGWSAEQAAKATAQLLEQGVNELQKFVEDYNKKNPVKLTQKEIDELQKVLKQAAEDRDKAATDYCGCGGGYSD